MSETQSIIERVPLHKVGVRLEEGGFIKQPSDPMIGNKPTYKNGEHIVIVCVPCGWIRHNGKMYRGFDVTEHLISSIVKDANS